MVGIVLVIHVSITYIEFFKRPIDALRVKTHAIIVWLSCNSCLVKASDGAFGELGVSYINIKGKFNAQ